MKYLIEIHDEIQLIADLRKKIQVDPPRQKDYEAQQWIHYTKVTKLNDAYYEAKNSIAPKIKSAYVTFRSMESKKRAIRGFEISWFQSMFAQYFCCLTKYFKKGKLLGSGQLTLVEPEDPNIILWENMEVGIRQKTYNRIYSISVMLLSLTFSYLGQFYWQIIAKSLKDLERSECSGENFFEQDDAWVDHLLPMTYKLGKMNCYCQQMFETYGEPGYKIIFADSL